MVSCGSRHLQPELAGGFGGAERVRDGDGEGSQGEGLVGLTRGFMYAGAPQVVVSLWKVDDAATAELMGRFYEGMLVRQPRPRRCEPRKWRCGKIRVAGALLLGSLRPARRMELRSHDHVVGERFVAIVCCGAKKSVRARIRSATGQ